MTSIPTPLAAAAWSLLVGLTLLLIVVYRQLAYHLQIRHTNVTSGLPAGVSAPEFAFSRVATTDDTSRTQSFSDGTATLLVFADPTCGSCEKLLHDLAEPDVGSVTARVRLLIASSATPASVSASPAFHRLASRVVRVADDVASHLYRTPVTPYAFAIDEAGVIRAHGSPQSPGDVASLIARIDPEMTATTRSRQDRAATGSVVHVIAPEQDGDLE